MSKILFLLLGLTLVSCEPSSTSSKPAITTTSYDVSQPLNEIPQAKPVVEAPAPFESYRIITTNDSQELATLVNKAMAEGFSLNQLQVTERGAYLFYTQTLWRRK